jgi:hypothetical protein
LARKPTPTTAQGFATFNDVPENIPLSEFEFAQHWLAWAKENKDYLKQGDKLFDRSQHFADVWEGDAGSLSGFAHIRGDHGYVFLLNPTPVEQIAELTLALDGPPSERFIVKEVYPGGMTLRGPENGQYSQGDKLRATVPAKQVRILWIAPSSANAGQQDDRPEDARVASWRRYVGDWTIVRHTLGSATLRSQFEFPKSGQTFLSNGTPEAFWASEPWGYDKAYLVLYLKDEREELNNNWVADDLASPTYSPNAHDQETFPSGGVPKMLLAVPSQEGLSVAVNGATKTPHAFKTKRVQEKGLTRCYFVDLTAETKAGEQNVIEVTVPIRTGLVFSGAYLDLPDQMP